MSAMINENYENLNDVDPALTNDFWQNQYLLFLQNSRQNQEYQIKYSNNLIEQIKKHNLMLAHRLQSSLNEELRRKLEDNLKQNNNLIHRLLTLRNLYLNNVHFFEWAELQLKNMCQEKIIDKPSNSVDENAHKARIYPHPTPFHYSPLHTNPLV